MDRFHKQQFTSRALRLGYYITETTSRVLRHGLYVIVPRSLRHGLYISLYVTISLTRRLCTVYATMSTPDEIAAKDAALLLGEVRVKVRLGLELG